MAAVKPCHNNLSQPQAESPPKKRRLESTRVVPDELGEFHQRIAKDILLLEQLGWEAFVKHKCPRVWTPHNTEPPSSTHSATVQT